MFAYWASLRRGASLPSRVDLHPSGIKRMLPTVSLIDVKRDLDGAIDYRLRLAGTGLYSVYGREITGRTLEDVYNTAAVEYWRRELDKVVTVVRVEDISSEDFVERDLMLVKVTANPQQRVEISLLVEMFRGRVVDIGADTLMVEISGQESKIEAFIDLMRPYSILELARTGRIALVRGQPQGQGEQR